MDPGSRAIRGVERAEAEAWRGAWTCSSCGVQFPASTSWWVVLDGPTTLRMVVCDQCAPRFEQVGPVVVDLERLQEQVTPDPDVDRVRALVDYVISVRGIDPATLALREADVRRLASERGVRPRELVEHLAQRGLLAS